MTTQVPPPIEDTLELRERLAGAWRAVFDNAVERGSPPQAVVETMASVAHERFAELFGASAAASYLQLLSEQLRDIDHDEAAFLVRGEEPRQPVAGGEPLIDPVWIDGQELI